MLKIRLQRVGRINMPAFRVVITEHARAPQAGNFVEKVGTYNPRSKERVLDAERIKYWISKGAQPSGTMHNMLISAGIISGKKINVLPKKHPPTPAVAESSGEAKPAVAESSREAMKEEAAPAVEDEVAADKSTETAEAPATSE